MKWIRVSIRIWMACAFAALTTHDQEALHADLMALWSAHNRSALANRTAVDAEYLEVAAIRSTISLNWSPDRAASS